MKQTAVEWFQDQIIKIVNGTCELSEIQIFNQAKEMEKKQIMDAAKIMLEGKIISFNSTEIGDKRAEQYYNKQFKQQ